MLGKCCFSADRMLRNCDHQNYGLAPRELRRSPAEGRCACASPVQPGDGARGRSPAAPGWRPAPDLLLAESKKKSFVGQEPGQGQDAELRVGAVATKPLNRM